MSQVVLLAANPAGTQIIDWDREFRSILQILQPKGVVCYVWPATEPDDIPNTVGFHKPEILHFSGHGDEAGLTLHAPDGNASPVSTAMIKDWLREVGQDVKILILNACYTKEQADVLAEVVPCVIGMEGKLRDDKAKRFSGLFYQTLLNGYSVENSYQTAIAGNLLNAWLSCRNGVDPSSVFFSPKPRGSSKGGVDEQDVFLAALRYFPNGLLESVALELFPKIGASPEDVERVFKKSIAGLKLEGLPLIVPAKEVGEDLWVAFESAALARRIYPALMRIVTEQDAFFDRPNLGTTQFILLRDLIAVAAGAEIATTAFYDALGFKIDAQIIEASTRCQLVGSTLFASLVQFDTTLELDTIVAGARALLETHHARLSFQVLELFRDGSFFEEWKAEPVRLDAIVLWSKSAKDAGFGRSLHDEICQSYEASLRAIRESGAGQTATETQHAEAVILNNYGTQLAVYGPLADFPKAISLLQQSEALWEELRENARMILCRANAVSHHLDRGIDVPKDLQARMAAAVQVVDDIENEQDLFFFYYQYARLLRREGELPLAESQFKNALNSANASESVLAVLAKRQLEKTRYLQGKCTLEVYVSRLKNLLEELSARPTHAWLTNTSTDVCRELASLEPAQSWSHLAKAFRIARLAEGRAYSLERARKIVSEMTGVASTESERTAFLAEEEATLRKITGKARREALDWDDFKQLDKPA